MTAFWKASDRFAVGLVRKQTLFLKEMIWVWDANMNIGILVSQMLQLSFLTKLLKVIGLTK